MKHIVKISTFFLLLIVLGSCQNKSNEQNEERNEEAEELEETSNTVALRMDQLDVMDIKLGTITQVDLGETIEVTGQLELRPQDMASVSAIVGGRVQSVTVIEGDHVKKGQ
ncbi:MAG: biotin/lipoyl-binding protein, partial [Maribacter sp.]|nr:biotin/lipoyl-binding protein [Maribacter sp.]